ncbi:bifunctional demethylmenaquinone methyltransferase/2-methoxy-6-polyprenyl-1,4-benzoquinol methylase UbiE [Limosilactobacillus panis]|uniref:Demethylmenaquinone methyltransferase n=1 Tax=Limosilactobacillus panis TaxID=47493 RepID=A0ABT7VKX9_9LACO|nr:bifunctional demethylmenaquinone methyltransferase/2-methoxy-6-polyprenyl-1,4-benzoquinol methylase UbiE [Limosilactobacillus panis]MDM8333397.1 bifunctional demethylmenaquinone methyltransferase/2-methoxy-6-polyprenyl-1,4-benzoquinol methylase UbiE [Limosilactobacillus panis]HJA21909.1 bifunctional demethylmenaquinone methyltransferase/2-methoxy-6-polyprenyl-1,4-benzoquinol methylase UbiE [Candidatus Limosilactobacillus intestinipullorum]
MVLTNHHPESEVNQMFSRVAEKYDLMNNVISLGTQKHWRKELFDQVTVRAGMDCLDLCCGTGDLTLELAKQAGPSGRVVGLDFNQQMLELARIKARRLNYRKDIELVQADAMHLPFADSSFDVVTIGFGLRNVPDANQVLAEAYRVLKPGGTFACLEMSQPTNPLIKLGWRGYFKVFPHLARLFGANVNDYQYLQETAQQFMSATELLTRMQEVGFRDCFFRRLNWGAGALHVGTKIK